MANENAPDANYAARIKQWSSILRPGEQPSPQCLARAKRDVKDFYTRPPRGIYIAPEDDDVTKINGLLVGSFDTPYEGGFFHVILKCPPDYPLAPPRVRFLTTDQGRVQFNPHFFPSGNICLSILGTQSGNMSWSAAQSLASLLASIHSLLHEYHTVPGSRPEEQIATAEQRRRNDDSLQHETIRVAVCGVVEECLDGTSLLPPALRKEVFSNFLDFSETYENIVKSKLSLSGSQMAKNVRVAAQADVFRFDSLLAKLQSLKVHVIEREKSALEEKNQ